MPIKIIYTEDKGVVLEYSGDVTGEDVIDAVKCVYENNNFLNLKYWIADRTGCNLFNLDMKDAEILSSLSKDNYSRNPNLILSLVSPKDLEYGMSRMYQIMTQDDGFKTKVVRSRKEADDWIESEISNSKRRPN